MTNINLSGVFLPIPTSFEGGRVAHDKLTSNIKNGAQPLLAAL